MSDQEQIDILCNRVDMMACGKCGKHLDVSDLAPFSVISCPDCQTEQTVPAQLGQFLLVEQLGAGGMGAVYRAVDQALGRFVAIKVMKTTLGDDPALVESFLREARAAAALNHANIVQIYSCGQEKGQPYIVMELVGGGRLDQMMASGKPVDEVRLLEIALDVAEGLKAANGVGLVHGDIKPANILFDKSGTAKVVDFGLAQFVNRQQEQGGIWGTPYYISPERARGGKADHRSDIYSLGATIFHALSGVPPFDGKTAADVVVARLKAPPPRLRDLVPTLQPETAALVERMMAADPVLRYPTSASLLADMRHALHQAREARSVTGRARKQPKREWSHLIVLGVMAVVLIAVVVMALHWYSAASRRAEPVPAPAPAAPVAAEAPATNKEAEAEGLTVQQTEGGKLKMSILFFTGDGEKALVAAAAELAGPRPMAMYERLEVLSTNVPRNSARMMWLRVMEAVPLWISGEPARADKLLREVASAQVTQRRGHPVYMPQVMAQYMIGDLSDDRLSSERADWPAWYGDLASFMAGLKGLTRGDLEGGAGELEAYVKSRRAEPAWAYGFRPAAQGWLAMLAGLQEKKKEVALLTRSGQFDAARAAVEAYAKQAPAFMGAGVETLRATLREAETALAAQAQAQAERARRLVVQRDLERLDEVMATNVTLVVNQKEYRKVSAQVIRLAGELETPEGREQARIVREQLDRMDALKTLLIKEIEGNPFRQEDRELGGEAVSANVLGVRVSMAGHGTVLREWAQVSPRLMVRLLSYYIPAGGREPKAQADLYISLAVFSAFNGGHETAASFLRQAVEADPSCAPAARRMLPDALAEGT